MTDLELIDAVATQVEAAMAASTWGFVVLQKEQPTQQGIPYAPTVFFEKLFDYEYGFTALDLTYNPTPDNYSETETQMVETTFQISAAVIQNPQDTTIPTASDVANYCKLYMNSRHVVRIFSNLGINVLRVNQVRNPYFEDDRHRLEAYPNFDLVVAHRRQLTLNVPAASSIVAEFEGPVL